jgi:hypothetical protein
MSVFSSGISKVGVECQSCLANSTYNVDFSLKFVFHFKPICCTVFATARRYHKGAAKLSELLLLVIQWAIVPCVAAFAFRFHFRSDLSHRLDASTKLCLMFLTVGASFSALDWTLWWCYKCVCHSHCVFTTSCVHLPSMCFCNVLCRYQPLVDASTVLIVVYWFKPLGFAGYVSAKGMCVHRVLRCVLGVTRHTSHVTRHTSHSPQLDMRQPRQQRQPPEAACAAVHVRHRLSVPFSILFCDARRMASSIILTLAVSLVAAGCVSLQLRASAPDMLLLFHSTGALCVLDLVCTWGKCNTLSRYLSQALCRCGRCIASFRPKSCSK